MGYTIEYNGRFNLNKPLTKEYAKFLHDFAKTRHYQRVFDENDPTGIWFTDPNDTFEPDFFHEDYKVICSLHSENLRKKFLKDRWGCIDYNTPPVGMPGLWCQWIPTEDNMGIEWDGCEKFYNAYKWLEFIIENYLKPYDYILNGEVTVYDEEEYETGSGYIIVTDNKISFQPDESLNNYEI